MKFILAIAEREVRIRLRNPILPLWDLLAPLINLVIFGASFTAWFPPPPGVPDYNSFFLAGVLGMVTFTIAWNSSYAFFEDLQSGIFHELLTYPFPRRDLILGKLLFNLCFGLLANGICCLVGVLLLGIRLPLSALPGLALWIVLGMAGWYFVYTLIALRVRGFNAYHTTTSGLYLVLMFVSNVFYPIAALPEWIRWLARLNPVSWQIDLMRAQMLPAVDGYLPVRVMAFILFTLAAFYFSNRALTRPVE